MHHVDLLPTFVAAAGGRIPPPVDGVDQWGAITKFAEEHAALATLGADTKVLSAATWGPRDEIVFDISLSSLNKSNGLNEAPVDMRVPYVDGVVAYRFREMKLLRRHTDDVWYAPSTRWKPNCTAQYCQMNKEFEITHRCGWDTFLFNLTEDPDERNNLVLGEKLLKVRAELETRVRATTRRATTSRSTASRSTPREPRVLQGGRLRRAVGRRRGVGLRRGALMERAARRRAPDAPAAAAPPPPPTQTHNKQLPFPWFSFWFAADCVLRYTKLRRSRRPDGVPARSSGRAVPVRIRAAGRRL